MQSFVDLRKEHPELFEGLKVYQQPAAFLDGVIHRWILEDQGKEFPAGSLFQRDTLATHSTVEAHEAMALIWQVQALVAGKMTPVLQLTDTDQAKAFKDCARDAKDALLFMNKERCRKAGDRLTLKCGHKEYLWIIQEALTRLKVKTEANNTVLAGLRRNGNLAWRPNLQEGTFERADKEAWARSLPEESHRLKKSWRRDRYEWLEADGTPQKPDYKGVGQVAIFLIGERLHLCNPPPPSPIRYTMQLRPFSCAQ